MRFFALLVGVMLLACSSNEDISMDDGSEESSVTLITFADTNFEAALLAAGVDTDGDGAISTIEAQSVTTLDISGNSEVTSLLGIGYFTSLEVLDASSTSIGSGSSSRTTSFFTDWDLLLNVNLLYLDISNTCMESIDLSMNTMLSSLNVSGTLISELDLTSNISLITLWAYDCENLASIVMNDLLDYSEWLFDEMEVNVTSATPADTDSGSDSALDSEVSDSVVTPETPDATTSSPEAATSSEADTALEAEPVTAV